MEQSKEKASSPATANGLFVQAGTGSVYGVSGEVDEFMLTGEESDGRLAIVSSRLDAGAFAPWHVHDIDHEVFYVISGCVEVGLGAKVVQAGPGDLAMAPPGVPRCYKALQASRMLSINSPGGPSEGFLREVLSFTDVPTEEDKKQLEVKYKIRFVASPSGYQPMP